MLVEHGTKSVAVKALSALWLCGALTQCAADHAPSHSTDPAAVAGAAGLQPMAAAAARAATRTPASLAEAAGTEAASAALPAGGAAPATGTQGPRETPPSVEGAEALSYGPLVPEPGETCYEFKTHASTRTVDDSPYPVVAGEHYAHFYFKAPWPDGTVATRFGARYDNPRVLHHWLLFQTSEDQIDGYHETASLPTLLGVNATLISGWDVGGANLVMPKDVGQELPSKGTQLNIQWHFYNSTDEAQADKSIVMVCTVPASMRPHTASIAWIGTEDLNGNKQSGGAGMPPHQKSTFSGTCDPLREGMASNEPIHIVAFWPHMHELGTSMQAIVNHTDGTKQTLFDKPFEFNHQVHYMQKYDLAPGDTLTAVCNYNNTTNAGVAFGESSDAEMCYLFTFAWPAHALEDHATSLIGASNTCW